MISVNIWLIVVGLFYSFGSAELGHLQWWIQPREFLQITSLDEWVEQVLSDWTEYILLLNVMMLTVYRPIFGNEDDDGIPETDDNEEESDLAIVKHQHCECQATADAIDGQVHHSFQTFQANSNMQG